MPLSTTKSNVKRAKRYPVIEVFGPTVQGEGAMSGTLSHFLRFGGCGLRCIWCDSMYAVDPAQIKENRTMMTDGEIFQYIKSLPFAPYVTFTGGDPCVQKDLSDLITWLNLDGIMVAVETQGQLFPDWLGLCDQITFSPKPPSSGNPVDPKKMFEWLMKARRAGPVCIKVVVFNEEDFQYAMNIYNQVPWSLVNTFYFTAGTEITTDLTDPVNRSLQVLQAQSWLADRVLQEARGTNFSDKVHVGCQQHVLLWPAEDKGV